MNRFVAILKSDTDRTRRVFLVFTVTLSRVACVG